jgi:hypothetical protein
MKIGIKAIRLERALHAIREWQDAEHLVALSEQDLVAFAWKDVQHFSDKFTVTIGPKGVGTVLATDVAVDNTWLVEPKSQRILLAREGVFDVLDPAGKSSQGRINVAGLENGTFASALDSEGKRVLLVVLRVINPDSAEYGIAVADLVTGRLVRERRFGSTAELELLWDAQQRTWLIGETSTATLWRWDETTPAVKLAGTLPGHVHAATFVAGQEGTIVTALIADTTGGTVLAVGRAEHDRISWGAPITLSGHVLVAHKHPARPLWASVAQQGMHQQIQLLDASGKTLAEVALRPDAHLLDLMWSPSSPTRLWGTGIHCLAAATIEP